MKIMSASDANRHFSSVLREVASGEVVTVLSRGKAVAAIVPVPSAPSQRLAAKRTLLDRLRLQKASGKRNWTRDELYENE